MQGNLCWIIHILQEVLSTALSNCSGSWQCCCLHWSLLILTNKSIPGLNCILFLLPSLLQQSKAGGNTQYLETNIKGPGNWTIIITLYITGIIRIAGRRGGLMVNALDSGASCLGSSPGREHCVMFLGKTLYFLSIQVYKWVPANCWGNQTNCGEVTCDGLASHPREVEILLAASCHRYRHKLRQLPVWASLGSKASP